MAVEQLLCLFPFLSSRYMGRARHCPGGGVSFWALGALCQLCCVVFQHVTVATRPLLWSVWGLLAHDFCLAAVHQFCLNSMSGFPAIVLGSTELIHGCECACCLVAGLCFLL
jgi:hypothetical protein